MPAHGAPALLKRDVGPRLILTQPKFTGDVHGVVVLWQNSSQTRHKADHGARTSSTVFVVRYLKYLNVATNKGHWKDTGARFLR
jgi:hypothetical protein